MKTSLADMINARISHVVDPLEIRKSTARVVKNARFVKINLHALANVARLVSKQVKTGHLLTDTQFGVRNNSPQKIFLMDTVNFCFWAHRDENKWNVEYPKGNVVDGWNALAACFDRALEEHIPILDTTYLTHLSLAQAAHLFRSANDTEIPLLKERLINLRQAGRILRLKWKGSVDELLKDAHFDAIGVAQTLVAAFPSFRDKATLENASIYFYKRAQICAYDLSLLPNLTIGNTKALTIFADYKLPQLLRAANVITYSPILASTVDNYKVIPKGSRMEIEIRAATVWACELIADHLRIDPVLVDNALWLMAATENYQTMPYHRTRTMYY